MIFRLDIRTKIMIDWKLGPISAQSVEYWRSLRGRGLRGNLEGGLRGGSKRVKGALKGGLKGGFGGWTSGLEGLRKGKESLRLHKKS